MGGGGGGGKGGGSGESSSSCACVCIYELVYEVMHFLHNVMKYFLILRRTFCHHNVTIDVLIDIIIYCLMS